MRIRDTIRRAGRSLRQAKTRTLLTSLAISVGAFTVTLALAAGAGSQAYTDSLLKNNGDVRNLSVFTKENSGTEAPREYGSSDDQTILDDQDIEKIKKIDGVADITPAYNIQATYMTRGGANKKYEAKVDVKADQTALPLVAGKLEANRVPVGSIVVPEVYLKPLGFSSAQEAIGQPLTVHIEKPTQKRGVPAESEDKTFTIAAVDKKATTMLQYQAALRFSVEDAKAMYDYQSGGMSQSDRYASLHVRVKDGADVETVQQAIKSAGYTVYSLQDIQEALFQFINVLQWGVAGFGFLAILASIFGIINTQYISVLERTQQIGLMKALGARRKDIARLFRFEAAWVGFLGGMIGTGLALLAGFFNPLIAKSLQLEPGIKLLQFNPMTSVILIFSLVIIAIAAGYFPSRKAAKLDPIEALRTE